MMFSNARICAVLIATVGSLASALAQEKFTDEQKALVLIADFADRVCVVAPLERTKTQGSVSGSVTAEFAKLLKSLVGLGATAAAKYESSTDRGVVPEHLAAALADANKCKLTIWADLSERLLPKTEKGCRHPEHGVEYWGHTERWPADSGWRRGGSSPLQYCGSVKVARERKYPNHNVTLIDTAESHKTERKPFKKDYYRYTCAFEDRWQPILKFADTQACRK